MKFSRLLVGVALPVMMAGCASFPGTTYELDELEHITPTGAPFTQALSREYAAFAESERQQYDWFNSQHFAEKGLASAHGTAVAPENLDNWHFADKQAAADLAAARSRLMTVLGTTAPNHTPALTATAQVKFDCWVEQQDEGWQTDDIEACRRDFLAAMEALETQVKPVAAPAPAPAAAPVAQVKAERFQVFFDFNQDKLSPEADKIVTEVAKAAKAAGYPKLSIGGYTDLAGSAEYNIRLSLRRAEVVRRALIAQGVPADRLTAEGHGKADPLVATADGVREPQNRRVVIGFPG